MKTVKSVSALKAMALARGAAVEMGATRFNSSKDKVSRLNRPAPVAAPDPQPEPAPAPQPAVTEVSVDLAPVAAAIERAQAMQVQLMQSMLQQVSMLKPGQAPQEWEFTVKRNPDGTLVSIHAKAIQ